MSPLWSGRRTAPSAGLALGILAEDLQGALAAASRLQQRGVRVQVVQDPATPIGNVEAVVVDMNIHNVVRDVPTRVQEWAAWLRDQGAERLGSRFDSEFRGRPADCLAGAVAGSGYADPVVLAIPGYPSAGRVCVEGRMLVPSVSGPSLEIDVRAHLFRDQSAALVPLVDVTAGPAHVLEIVRGAHAAGERRFVFDSTADGHLATMREVTQQLRDEGLDVVTASSGGWLRYHPDLGSDGFVVLVSACTHEMDRAQFTRVADIHGGRAVAMTATELIGASVEHLTEIVALHRVVVLHETDRVVDDPWIVAADFGTAVRRLLEVSAETRNPCQGVVTSGGLTTSAVIRALAPDSLRAGQELEPLCPVARLDGGPFDNLPVISKASGIGTEETPARLIRRLLGT